MHAVACCICVGEEWSLLALSSGGRHARIMGQLSEDSDEQSTLMAKGGSFPGNHSAKS